MSRIKQMILSGRLLLLFICCYAVSFAQPTAPQGKKLIVRERLASMVHYYPSGTTGSWHQGDSTVFSWSGENCSEQLYDKFPDIHISYDRSATETVYSNSQLRYITVKHHDEQGRPTGCFSGKWNTSYNKWDTIFTSRLTYDNQSRLIDSTISYFDKTNSSLRDSIKIQYSYTEHDTVRTKLIMNNGSWENFTRDISTTDGFGRMICKVRGGWNKLSRDWEMYTRDSFSYTGSRRFTHLQQYLHHNPDTTINSRRTHYICYSGRPVPEIDSVESWSGTRNKWYTSLIKKRAFLDGRILKEFSCARDTVRNRLDTSTNLYYASYKDTSVTEYGDMYWDKTSGNFIRYPYINLIKCDSMGMITQLKSCLVYPNDSLDEKEMIVYYYEKFYVTVDAPPQASNDIILYPNPSINSVQTHLRISINGTHDIGISVCDILGRQLLQDHFVHTDIYEGTLPSGAWPPGTYLVSVFVDGSLKSTMKLIK